MSVTVKCYTNTSDRRTANKTLELIASKDCEFKGDVDVLRPVLLLTGDASTYSLCNYVQIPAFNRYYYATVKSVPGGMVEISCSRDPLTTAWHLGLPDRSAVIERQENNWNLYLNDGTLKAYANDLIQTKKFTLPSPVPVGEIGGFSSPQYVVIVAG